MSQIIKRTRVIEDKSPQLGGKLDANGNPIVIGDSNDLWFDDSESTGLRYGSDGGILATSDDGNFILKVPNSFGNNIITFENSTTSKGEIRSNGVNGIEFKTNGVSAGNRVMVLDENQDVGIGTTTPSEKLHVDGNIATDDVRQSLTSTSSSATTNGERFVLADSSGGAITITLASADAVSGKQVTVKDSGNSAGSNTITVDTEGSETIDGSSSQPIDANSESLEFVSDGANWFVAARFAGGGLL